MAAAAPVPTSQPDRPNPEGLRVAPPRIPNGRRAIVIGGGIGGLTTGALLARRGWEVVIYDLAIVPGGCASTFRRRGFTFDVGATQVAGLEPGGIHHRIFQELAIALPAATPCDPACAVFLPGETEPISVWRDPARWQAERQRQFPGSEPFWKLMGDLFHWSWNFQSRDPVLPPRNAWDVVQLLQALRPETLLTVPYTLATVGDALRGYGLGGDRRLKMFLDLQLKLYSQVDADETALLYAATALGVSQAPLGLWHLEGSMQVLSDRLVAALTRDGGTLRMRHRVEQIWVNDGRATGVVVRDLKTDALHCDRADVIIANVPAQNLTKLVHLGGNHPPANHPTHSVNSANTADSDHPADAGDSGDPAAAATPLPTPPHTTTALPPLNQWLWRGYQHRTDKLPEPSGAFVVYLGVKAEAIPADCPPHLQFFDDPEGPIGENNSLFVSVSRPGDGRAPEGMATITASSFTDPRLWWAQCEDYAALKQAYTDQAIARLAQFFTLTPDTIIHREAATPRTFVQFTGRDRGYVGGLGQRVSTFGPFGYANRTPIPGLWLVGDSTHPGEGTAGVSYSALTTVRQITAEWA